VELKKIKGSDSNGTYLSRFAPRILPPPLWERAGVRGEMHNFAQLRCDPPHPNLLPQGEKGLVFRALRA
jgi:hypothetical protein